MAGIFGEKNQKTQKIQNLTSPLGTVLILMTIDVTAQLMLADYAVLQMSAFISIWQESVT